MTLSMKSTIGELDTVLPAAYIDTKGYNNTIMIAERGSIQFFFRYIAKDRRDNKETNNYQSYRTKKDTLSFTIYLFFSFILRFNNEIPFFHVLVPQKTCD